MVLRKRNTVVLTAAVAGLSLFFSTAKLFAQEQEEDPPSRVARLNYLNGNVSMEPAGVNDWAPAELNRPFTIGDYLFADQGGAAELHLDVAVIRMGSQTSFGFLNLDDRTVQLKLTEGDLYVRVHNFGADQVFEVDTPNAAVNLLRDGIYRFRVDANGNMSFVVVREGQAEITGGGQSFALNPDNSATLSGTDQLSYDIGLAPQADEFDQWCQGRDAHEAHSESARYLPATVVGSEDLDDYGNWQDSGEYGAVWYPRSVPEGWAPYSVGHWAWIDPWGWTWIDGNPWGFAPFHYGRWVYAGSRWGWCPGPIAVGYRGPAIRPYYAPALVAWFGGEHWGVGISVGGGPSLGWVPLGWGEVYTPSYRCSPRYFNNVNVYNTHIVNNVNITNVYNTVYVNKQVYHQQFVNVRAPNAVKTMPQGAFASGRPVQQNAVAVRQAELAHVQGGAVVAPPVAPTRQSFLASASTRPVVRPAAQVVQRPVIAKSTPPAPPAPFAARQPYLERQAGQPFNAQAMRSSLPPSEIARPAVASVRQAPAARPVTVRPGERVGTAAATINRPVQQPGPATAARPVSPTEPAAQPRGGASGPAQQPQQPTPAAHGVPPNLRQQQPPASQPAGNGRYAEPAPGTNRQNEPAGNERYNQPAQRANQPPANDRYNNERPPATPAQEQQQQQQRYQQQQEQQRYQQQQEQQRYQQQQEQKRYQQQQQQQRQEQPQQQNQQRYEQQQNQQRNQQQEQQRYQQQQQQQQQERERAQQPAPARPTAPAPSAGRPEPQPRERAEPAAPAPSERRGYPERGAQPHEEKSAPPPQQQHENKAPAHEDHSKPDHKDKK